MGTVKFTSHPYGEITMRSSQTESQSKRISQVESHLARLLTNTSKTFLIRFKIDNSLSLWPTRRLPNPNYLFCLLVCITHIFIHEIILLTKYIHFADSSKEIPKTWKAMNDSQNLMLVDLKPSDQEYTTVEKEFKSTLGRTPTIVKVNCHHENTPI